MRDNGSNSIGLRLTFVWTALQVFIKVLCGLVINKVVAISIGPSGLALIGQFQNFFGLCVGVASGSISSGIVKYTAQYNSDLENKKIVLANSLYIHFFMTFLVLFFVVIFGEDLSNYFFDKKVTSVTLIFFAFTLLFSVLNLLILSVVNGMGDHKTFSILNILVNIYMAFFVVIGAIYFGLNGVIYGYIISQSSVFLITWAIAYRKYNIKIFLFDKRKFNYSITKKLLQYGVVSFVSGTSMTVMLLAVRSIIVQTSSLEIAGLWEALWRMSLYFIMIGSLPASIYYLPKYAAINSIKEIKRNFWESVRFIIPLLIVIGLFICYFRNYIVRILFSDEFIPMVSIIPLILMGDIIKVSGYLIVNVLYAKGLIKQLICIDISSNSLMILFSYLLFPIYDLKGLSYAYLIVNLFIFLYLIFFFIRLDKTLLKRESSL